MSPRRGARRLVDDRHGEVPRVTTWFPRWHRTSYEKRNAFSEQLEEGLATVGVRLVYPDLGYLPDGRHVWHLTVEGPRGAVTLFSPLTPGADPYAPATVSDLVRRVGNWLTRAA